MASIFGHGFAAFVLGKSFFKKINRPKFLFLGIISSMVPDADTIGFHFSIAYDSLWGHRGFTHSILFAIIWSVLITAIFYFPSRKSLNSLWYIFYFFLCTISHGILDGLTNGGRGVAFFSPWDESRYFLPWRPIKVSPIGVRRFFTDRGLEVIVSELLWIGIPGIILLILSYTTSVLINKR